MHEDNTRKVPGGSESYLCHCFQKTSQQLRAEIVRLQIKSLAQAEQLLCAGQGCALCRPELEELLRLVWGRSSPEHE